MILNAFPKGSPSQRDYNMSPAVRLCKKNPRIALLSLVMTLPNCEVWSEPRGFCRFVLVFSPIVTQLWSLPFEKQLFSALLFKESLLCGWGGGTWRSRGA